MITIILMMMFINDGVDSDDCLNGYDIEVVKLMVTSLCKKVASAP